MIYALMPTGDLRWLRAELQSEVRSLATPPPIHDLARCVAEIAAIDVELHTRRVS